MANYRTQRCKICKKDVDMTVFTEHLIRVHNMTVPQYRMAKTPMSVRVQAVGEPNDYLTQIWLNKVFVEEANAA